MPTWIRHFFRPQHQPFARTSGERDPLGSAGEALAAKYLKKSGYKIIGVNLKVPIGEADILCTAPAPNTRTVVLVEVKSRRLGDDGSGPFKAPEASITQHKREKLQAILRHLDHANNWSATGRPTRIDTIAIEWPATSARGFEPEIRHHQAAVPVR